MLLEFTVGNFKSFRDKATFSMVAAPLRSEEPRLDRDNVLPVNDKLNVLRSAALYGANASGKSNLGAALRVLREFVLTSSEESRSAAGIPVEPFLFSTETRGQPSFFEMVFRAGGRQYRYGFEADKERVVSEWLFHVPKVKEAALFLRDGQEIAVKAGFKEGKGLETRTRPNALFLSVVAQFNGEVARRIRQWFTDFTVTTGLDDEYRSLTVRHLRREGLRLEVLALLSGLDLGFADLQVSERIPAAFFPPEMPETIAEREAAKMLQRIYTPHPIYDREGNKVGQELLDLDVHESQGTRKLVALAGILLTHLILGDPLFVDELDARLHPLITRRIIELFHSDRNSNGAQLIFATHDTNILDRALFRRDQVWFAEKDRRGGTHLYSLSDYSPRNDAAFEKNYLAGRYGAIPFVGDLSRLPEPTEAEEAPAPEAALA